MYSNEIDCYLRQHDYKLSTYDELQYIKDTSSQLQYIKIEEVQEIYSRFLIATTDNFHWRIYIKNYDKQI